MYEPYKFYFATSVNIKWSKTFILLYLTQQCQPFTISFCRFELIKIPFFHPNHFSIEYPLILRLRMFTCTVLRFKSEFNHTYNVIGQNSYYLLYGSRKYNMLLTFTA